MPLQDHSMHDGPPSLGAQLAGLDTDWTGPVKMFTDCFPRLVVMFPKMHSFWVIPHGPTIFKGLGIFSSLGQSPGPDTESGNRAVEGTVATRASGEGCCIGPATRCCFFLSPVVRVHRFLAGQMMAQGRGCISLPHSLLCWVWHQPSVLFFSKHQAFYDLLASSFLFCCLHMSIHP